MTFRIGCTLRFFHSPFISFTPRPVVGQDPFALASGVGFGTVGPLAAVVEPMSESGASTAGPSAPKLEEDLDDFFEVKEKGNEEESTAAPEEAVAGLSEPFNFSPQLFAAGPPPSIELAPRVHWVGSPSGGIYQQICRPGEGSSRSFL